MIPVKLVRVIDGDTVIVKNRGFRHLFSKKSEIRIRLYGIDAPESKQKGGKESTRYLKKLIGSGRTLHMKTTGQDKYSRTVALLYKGRTAETNSINRRMVHDGQARWYQAYGGASYGFKDAEEYAKKRKRGIWKHPEAQEPWNFRQGKKIVIKSKRKKRWLVKIIVFAIILLIIFIVVNIYGSQV